MAQNKKRGGGRVTPSKKARAALAADTGSPVSRGPGSRQVAYSRSPGASARYTPAQAHYRVRPRWHRLTGWVGVAVGVVIAVLNDAMLFTDHVTLLPFDHNEFYLVLAVVVAGSAAWFLGLFDRGTTLYH